MRIAYESIEIIYAMYNCNANASVIALDGKQAVARCI